MAEQVWKLYCPLMKELCTNGHTKKMGKDEHGELVRCALWQERNFVDKENQVVAVRACYFHHSLSMSIVNANEISRNTASTDKVANEVAKVRQTPVQFILPAPADTPAIEHNGRPD